MPELIANVKITANMQIRIPKIIQKELDVKEGQYVVLIDIFLYINIIQRRIYMSILAIADIHGKKNCAKTIKKMISKYEPELLIIAGDITNFGPISYAKKLLNTIQIKTLAIPGNCDPREVVNVIEESRAINLHKKKIKINNLTFVGIGGSNITPLNTIFEIAEKEIYDSLDKIMEKNAIFVTHAPPKNHLDLVKNVGNVGSSAILEIVEKYEPRLVISAHIHEARGVEYGKTIFVNPGPCSKGCGAIIEIDKKIVASHICV